MVLKMAGVGSSEAVSYRKERQGSPTSLAVCVHGCLLFRIWHHWHC